MKYLLALLGLTMLASCAGNGSLLDVQAMIQCDNQTLVVAASGNYPKGTVGELRVYRDRNLNKKFDPEDRTETQSVGAVLRSGEFYLFNPIRLSDVWADRYIFVVLKAGNDSTLVTVSDCTTSRTLSTD